MSARPVLLVHESCDPATAWYTVWTMHDRIRVEGQGRDLGEAYAMLRAVLEQHSDTAGAVLRVAADVPSLHDGAVIDT